MRARALFEYLFYLAYKSEVRHIALPSWWDRKPYLTLARLMLSVPLLFNAFTCFVAVAYLAGQREWLLTPGAMLGSVCVGFCVTSFTKHYFSDEQRSKAIIKRCQEEFAATERKECALDLLYYFGSMVLFFTTTICVYLQGLAY